MTMTEDEAAAVAADILAAPGRPAEGAAVSTYLEANGNTCPACYGKLEQVDGTTLYRCDACDTECDEDELDEQQ